jgi:pimeloyl-ACP methyl ester carboxylesterase
MGTFRLFLTMVTWGACSLLSGCSVIDKAILRSEDGRYAVARAEYNLAAYYRDVVSITPSGDFKIEEAGPGDDVLLLLHGFGTGEGVWGTREDRNSPLCIADEVFDGRVLVANYPSTESIDAIAIGLIAELEKLERKCGGKPPKITVFAHSLGGEVARCMVRKKPELFREVALVSAPNTGLHFGIMTGYIFKYYYKHYEELMLRHGVCPRRENQDDFRTSMDDLHPGCDFMKEINAQREPFSVPLDVTYHFFVFCRTIPNNVFIPGKDDSLISPGSAYPYAFIKRGEFEHVRFGTVVCFRGDVNHYTLIYNPGIVRTILDTLKSDSESYASSDPKKHGEVVRVRIPRAPPCEVEQRAKIERMARESPDMSPR